ncbi:NfeD family protein [Bartonella tamiae]|uniref:NfeD-like C-terminal domain-containing protein n=1 Tax=Bartonella tamiae Th239 TaxID=1094558 RepID=J1K0C6_9HYPH|nr:NfeD family protein [Bartonella tamiae]EJF90440.1 hypothetical protein ME5_00841 [Bartonella tamiae Th239]EJF93616.1 hypothetical protein MEG_01040 [Bartonella tamiae Th307]
METLITSLGPWNWIIFGFLLLLLEVLLPGVFLMWFGIGALLTALLIMILGDVADFSTWQSQIVIFLIFSVLMVMVGRQFFQRKADSDQPLLNKKTDELFGKTVVLSDPIINGEGRIRIDDTIWRINGPDLESGTRIKILSFDNGVFIVEKVEKNSNENTISNF